MAFSDQRLSGAVQAEQRDATNPIAQRVKRTAILLGCGLLAILSAIDVYSATIRNSSPDFALFVKPSDPIANVRMADYRLAIDQSDKTFLLAQQQVEKSLQSQAINPRALRILAMIAKHRKQNDKAERFIALANKTSRREFGTQIWLVEKAAASGDARLALHKLDLMLRSNPAAPKLLFPTLGKALSNSEFRQSFVAVIKNDPPWLFDFLSYAVFNDIEPVAQAKLLLAANGYPRAKRYRIIEATLIERLVKTAHYPEAALLGQHLYPKHRQAAQEIGVNSLTVTQNAAPFQWRTGASISANSALIVGTSKSESGIEAWAQPGNRTLAASKFLALPSGHYDFSSKVTFSSGKLTKGSSWQISCLNGEDQNLNWRLNLVEKEGASNSFQIGSGCRFQLLELYLEGGPASDGVRVEISGLSLKLK